MLHNDRAGGLAQGLWLLVCLGMSRPASSRCRTTNWSAFNAALRRRGSLLVWLNREMEWLAAASRRPGRPQIFSDAATRFCLGIKVLFGLALRETIGMVASLLAMARLDWPVPDCSTLCRRQKTVTVQNTLPPLRGASEPAGRQHRREDARRW